MNSEDVTAALSAASQAPDLDRPDPEWRAAWAEAIAGISPEEVRAWCRLRWAEAASAQAHVGIAPGAYWGVAPVATHGTVQQLAEQALISVRRGRNRTALAAVEALADLAVGVAGEAPEARGREAIAALARLRAGMTHRGLARRIGRALAAASAMRGLDPEALQDLTVEDGGLNADGTRTWAAGEHDLYLFLTEDGDAELTVFERGTGRMLGADASVLDPAYFRIQQEAKGVQRSLLDTLATQKLRLEQALESQRGWPATVWPQVFETNPVMRHLAERLVWSLPDSGSAMREASGWTTAAGQPVPDPTSGLIHLLHPLTTGGEVEAWRENLVTKRVVQPFKQLFRERIRPLDDEDPGARFDGLVVRLRTLAALLRARGWVGLGGQGPAGWLARRELPGGTLAAVLSVKPLGHHRDPHRRQVALGRVGLVTAGSGRPVSLVPLVSFSEAMRDVALAAAVAGSDPEDLRAVALADVTEARAALIDALLPQLGLTGVVTIEGVAAWIDIGGRRIRLDLLGGGATLGDQPVDMEGIEKADLPLYMPHEGADAATSSILATLLWLGKFGRAVAGG